MGNKLTDMVKSGSNNSLWNKWTGEGLTKAQQQQNAVNIMEAQVARAFNEQEAQKARDWEEQMSNTAYQRQVADMQAAGINPALAMNGAGASTPSGPAASGPAASAGNNNNGMSLGELLGAAMTPLSIIQGIEGIKQQKANIEQTNAQTDLIESQTATNEQLRDFNDKINPMRIKAQEISNDLSRAQEKKIYREIDNIIESRELIIKQTENEAEKKSLIIAQTLTENARAEQIVQMLPYQKALMEAQTSQAKAAAYLSAVEAAYKNKILNSDYLDNMFMEMSARATSADAKARMDAIRAEIREGKFGVEPSDGTVLGDIWHGVTAVGSGILSAFVNFIDNLNPLAGMLK